MYFICISCGPTAKYGGRARALAKCETEVRAGGAPSNGPGCEEWWAHSISLGDSETLTTGVPVVSVSWLPKDFARGGFYWPDCVV